MSASPELARAVSPEMPVAASPRPSADEADDSFAARRIISPSPPPPKDGKEKVEEDEEEECRTPTSVESKLPSVPKSCPPAPRKARTPQVAGRKRRPASVEPELFAVRDDEIERLFPRRERAPMVRAKRRKCDSV